MIYSIFISFTSKDEELKNALVEKLNKLKSLSSELEVNPWEMGKSCYGRWDRKCPEEIQKSDALICLLSENVADNSVVYEEIEEAKKLCDAGDFIFMPVILSDHHHAGDLSNYTCIYANSEERETWLDEVYGKLEDAVSERLKKPLQSEQCSLVRSAGPSEHFCGREKELEEIKGLFDSGKNIVVLSGMGGIGKTELAKEFARRYKSDFPETYIIKYYLPEGTDVTDGTMGYTAKDFVCSLAFESTPDTTDRDRIYNVNLGCLKKIDRKTLLIIDGCDISPDSIKDLNDVLSSLSCRFLFTSRNETHQMAFKRIYKMPSEDIVKLFRTYYDADADYGDTAAPKKEISDDEILELSEAVEYHTLTVTLMAKLLRTSRTVTLDRLKEKTFEVKAAISHERLSHEATIYEHIANIFDLSDLSDFKKNAMAILCRICSQGIDFDSIKDIINIDEETEVQINDLVRSGLVRCENGQYSLHPVISEVAYKKLPSDKEQELKLMAWISGSVLKFDKSSSPVTKESKLEYGIFYTNKRIDSDNTEEDYLSKLSDIYHNTAYLLNHLAQYDKALEYYGKALEIREKVFGPEHPDTAMSYNNTGFVYYSKGDYDKALEYYGKALAIYEKVFGDGHPDTAMSYNNIGAVYDSKGDYNKALEYYGKTLAIREKVLGLEHPDTATSYNNIGLVYNNKGDYDKALEYYGKAMAIYEKVLGPEHPSTAMSYNNIGLVYKSKGDYDKALEYYGKALAIQEKVLGPKHPVIATSYNNIGAVYDSKGDYNKALEYYGKALAIREKVLGPEHPSTVMSYNNIGAVYNSKGNYDKALEYHGKAMAIREKVLGPEHPDTAMSYNNMGGVYSRMGAYDKALEYYGKALAIRVKVLGLEHPDTAMSYNNTGFVYYSKGDYDKALEYYGKALAIYEKVFGDEHPDTARSYNNIGAVYDSKGDYNKALEYYGKALAIREEVLGPEHPSTATSYNNTGFVYYNKGDYDKALEYYGKAMAIYEKVLGPEHPDTVMSYNNIGAVYKSKGNYDKALEYYGKALAIREKVSGPEHPVTATSYNNIGAVYNSKGDYDKALEYYGKALAIKEKVFGPEHPSTAISYNNFAKVYFNMKKYDIAIEYLRKAYDVG